MTKTNAELADEIALNPCRIFTADELKQIIAALRRVPELRQKMRDIFKQYGIGDGSPGWIEHTDQDGKLRHDSMSFEGELIFSIEALLERPPSGEMVMAPRAIVEALSDLEQAIENARAMLSAAEAEGVSPKLEKAACCPDEQFERMEKDAARYRWLREHWTTDYPMCSVNWEMPSSRGVWNAEEVDAAIDSALKSRP